MALLILGMGKISDKVLVGLYNLSRENLIKVSTANRDPLTLTCKDMIG